MPGSRRKGASRRADIPAAVLSALNEGRDETVTLVEWLAIDMATLVGHTLRRRLGWRNKRLPW